MKYILTLIIALCFVSCDVDWRSNLARLRDIEDKENIIREEFQNEIKKLHSEIDSMRNEIEIIKYNTDTLKRGQAVIYDEVKKSNTSFWDRLF